MVGFLASLTGILVAYVSLRMNSLPTGLIKAPRQRAAILLAILLIVFGATELLLTSAIQLVTVRFIIGFLILLLYLVLEQSLIQSTVLIMGCLVMVRAAMLYFGFTP